MIEKAIKTICSGKDLTLAQSKKVFMEIFSHQASPVRISAFLTALAIKGESEDEIAGAASVIRSYARKVVVGNRVRQPIMDTCGTGGSGVQKFNISTAVGFVVSAAGIAVAKHGNRAMSSHCGSADVLQALGIDITVDPKIMAQAIGRVGIGFLYAPLYHPALKHVAGIRREIGIKTIFNILGPLCNPAHATYQLLGVHSPHLVQPLARVLRKLNVKKAFVVHGAKVKDEVSLMGPTLIAYLHNKKIESRTVYPKDFGLPKVSLKAISASSASQSARIIRSIFSGKKSAARDCVLASASCCFYLAGKVKTLKEGVRLAGQIIDSGQAQQKLIALKQFVVATNKRHKK